MKKCVRYVNFTKFTVTLNALRNYRRMKDTNNRFIYRETPQNINHKEDISNLSFQPSLYTLHTLYQTLCEVRPRVKIYLLLMQIRRIV